MEIATEETTRATTRRKYLKGKPYNGEVDQSEVESSRESVASKSRIETGMVASN